MVPDNNVTSLGTERESKRVLYVAIVVPISVVVLAFASYVIWACTRKNDAIYVETPSQTLGRPANVIIDDMDGTKPREVYEVKGDFSVEEQ